MERIIREELRYGVQFAMMLQISVRQDARKDGAKRSARGMQSVTQMTPVPSDDLLTNQYLIPTQVYE